MTSGNLEGVGGAHFCHTGVLKLLLTNQFIQNNVDDTKYVYKYLFTVPL